MCIWPLFLDFGSWKAILSSICSGIMMWCKWNLEGSGCSTLQIGPSLKTPPESIAEETWNQKLRSWDFTRTGRRGILCWTSWCPRRPAPTRSPASNSLCTLRLTSLLFTTNRKWPWESLSGYLTSSSRVWPRQILVNWLSGTWGGRSRWEKRTSLDCSPDRSGALTWGNQKKLWIWGLFSRILRWYSRRGLIMKNNSLQSLGIFL